MGVLSRLGMRGMVRLWITDTDTVSPGLTDAQINDLLQEAVYDFAAIYPEELQAVLASPAFAIGVPIASINFATGTIRSITRMERATPTVAPMERLKLWRLKDLQLRSPLSAPPDRWAAERNSTSPTFWIVHVYPTPAAATTCNVYGTFNPADFSSDAGTPPYGDAETRWIARMAAVTAAWLIDDDGLAEKIAASLPEKIRAHLYVNRGAKKPRPETSEEVI